MSAPTPGQHPPRGAFQGHWWAPGVPGGVPVWLTVDDGVLALMAPGQGPTGFVDVFRVPVHRARVTSAAQRITVTVDGRAYPILARPHGPVLGAGLGVAASAAGLAGRDLARGRATAARAANLAADAAAFSRLGGHEVIAALRQSGVPVRRMGYGVLLTVGLAIGLLVAVLVAVVTVVVVSAG